VLCRILVAVTGCFVELTKEPTHKLQIMGKEVEREVLSTQNLLQSLGIVNYYNNFISSRALVAIFFVQSVHKSPGMMQQHEG
jgi:hypothetical protein